jgi:uncharacterized membrane protein YfcA
VTTDLMVLLAVAAGAVAQAVTGLGFALVCSPFLVSALGAREGVRLLLVLSAVVNLVVLARDHDGVRRGDLMRLLVPAALVTPLMAAVVRRVDATALAVAAAATTVVAAIALAAGLEVRRAAGRAGAVVAGAVSGGLNVIAGISGPPVALYALNSAWPQRQLRSTLQAYFLALNLVAMAFLGLPRLTAYPVAGLVLGLVAGPRLAGRVPEGWARAGTLSLAAAGGLATIARALL